MKRTLSTVVLFVLLLLTVVALTKISAPKSTNTLSLNASGTVVWDGTN